MLNQLFEPELLKEIEEKGKHATFREGDLIMDIGQSIRNMPLVLKGNIKVSRLNEDGQEILLYYVGEEESCAMTFTCCMMTQVSEVKAVAEDDVELIFIPVEVMDAWMSKYPTWKSFVMRTMRVRFNELLKTIDNIAFKKLDERLVAYLKEKAKTTGSSLLHLTHQQISDDLASSRVVISRLLKKLENDKKLLLYRNEIKLLSTM